MNKLFSIIAIGISSTAFSQVILNADAATAKTSLSSTSVLLEFGNDGNKGIILPYVETVPAEGSAAAKGGTLIFDVSASGQYKVKVKNENANWTDLSVESGFSPSVESVVKDPQASPMADKPNAKAIIGSPTSTSEGVLVLESSDKAMVLPLVANFEDIKNPSPGMMAFVKHPTDNAKHRLIVFNGQKWTFWEAN